MSRPVARPSLTSMQILSCLKLAIFLYGPARVNLTCNLSLASPCPRKGCACGCSATSPRSSAYPYRTCSPCLIAWHMQGSMAIQSMETTSSSPHAASSPVATPTAPPSPPHRACRSSMYFRLIPEQFPTLAIISSLAKTICVSDFGNSHRVTFLQNKSLKGAMSHATKTTATMRPSQPLASA